MRITSAAFRSNVLAVHGESGSRWLQDIPSLLVEIGRTWDVDIGSAYELSYSYVAAAISGSAGNCVVKLTVPGSSGLDARPRHWPGLPVAGQSGCSTATTGSAPYCWNGPTQG